MLFKAMITSSLQMAATVISVSHLSKRWDCFSPYIVRLFDSTTFSVNVLLHRTALQDFNKFLNDLH
ncbi:hypothetical protein T4A_5813, partial [Trichinella pseudospiralis]